MKQTNRGGAGGQYNANVQWIHTCAFSRQIFFFLYVLLLDRCDEVLLDTLKQFEKLLNLSRTTEIQTKPKRKREQRASVSPRSEEESSHPAADALPVVQDVELVDELVHAVARLGDGAQVGHEAHVITLLQRRGEKRGNRRGQKESD